jgi:CheY-like chemotaxis protein
MKNVLIVEDDPLLALMLGDVLVDAGYDVEHAANLTQGEELLAAGPIDAAILDIRIGGGVSYPLARALDARRIPYLFASSMRRIDMPPDLRWTPLIGKPYTPGQVITALQALCGDICTGAESPAAVRQGHPSV